jgi:segregation and condensation protein A
MREVGEVAGEGTEIQSVTLYKLMKTFDRVIKRMHERMNKPQHVVFRYNYTMDGSRQYLLDRLKSERSLSFEHTFEICEDRIHAIFIFLSVLELVQLRFINLMTGNGRNNFILEWNDDAPEASALEALIEADKTIKPELN